MADIHWFGPCCSHAVSSRAKHLGVGWLEKVVSVPLETSSGGYLDPLKVAVSLCKTGTTLGGTYVFSLFFIEICLVKLYKKLFQTSIWVYLLISMWKRLTRKRKNMYILTWEVNAILVKRKDLTLQQIIHSLYCFRSIANKCVQLICKNENYPVHGNTCMTC